MHYEEGPAEETEAPNHKKRKGSENESESSEDEFVAAGNDPTVIANLVSSANKSNTCAAEMEQIAKVQSHQRAPLSACCRDP